MKEHSWKDALDFTWAVSETPSFESTPIDGFVTKALGGRPSVAMPAQCGQQHIQDELARQVLRLAAESAALKGALEDISMERQNFTDRFSRQGLDDAHKLFDLADAALASPTETAKEAGNG